MFERLYQEREYQSRARSHVLWIDDCPEEGRALTNLLSAQPWLRVSLIDDPRRGYARAAALKPDLILLDVAMPGMDGFAICRLLRESPETRETPIIFLTGAGSIEDRLAGLSLGGVDYVLKPYDPREVLARIQVHLQLAASHRETVPSPARDDARQDIETAQLHAAMRFIEDSGGDLPTLESIARKVGTNEKRLSQIFRKHLNTTVFAFVREMHMRQGQKLLSGSDMPIRDIAHLVGFGNAANFATAFRERYGLTPSEFRRQARTGSHA